MFSVTQLENRKDEVYTYGFFNDTTQGGNAKKSHKGHHRPSIYANQLVVASRSSRRSYP